MQWSRGRRSGSRKSFARRWLALILLLAAPAPGHAFEFFDGSVQVHGFYEAQMRVISSNFQEDLDLTQWYNVLNIETEYELLSDGWGPFDLVSFYARLEARYDCVWTRGCGTMRSANTYGDRAAHLPPRLQNAKRTGLTGTTFTGDTRELAGVQAVRVPGEFRLADNKLDFADKDTPVGDVRAPAYLWHFPGVDTLFSISAPNPASTPENPLPDLNPAVYVFDRFVQPGDEYRFGARSVPAATNGRGLSVLGPWLPKNKVQSIGALADRANPFNPKDINPLFGTPGSTELPFRPAPNVKAREDSKRSDNRGSSQARGLYLPNDRVREMMRDDSFSNPDVNFRQAELEWNRGASQQDEKELKEIYVDMEFFDSRLWVRLGKQSIVWGKTELFRTTDQMNPQDLGLASLPSLEESRIALWSARMVYSFYEVGPFSDVRVELAGNFDEFEPVDIGACGEAYAPNAACSKSRGLFAHGLVGQGVAGEKRPADPWESTKGWEGGARLEFRWDKFSFALTDFYGYSDFPTLDVARLYSRNVDPISGRPRIIGSTKDEDCRNGTEPACLLAGSKGDHSALLDHHANQQRFAVICASSVGFSDLDSSVCAQSVLNSNNLFAIFPISQVLGAILRGNDTAKGLYTQLTNIPPVPNFSGQGLRNDGDFNGDGSLNALDSPLIALVNDQNLDGGPLMVDPSNPDDTPFLLLGNSEAVGISTVLSGKQEALLGCGSLWGTNCDRDGIDLLNTEASAFAEAWPGQQGTFGDWDTTDGSFFQPGTAKFDGGATCTRYEKGRRRLRVLPGCNGVKQDGVTYVKARRQKSDGTVPHLRSMPPPGDLLPDQGTPQDILVHPFTGQPFRSEMTAFSFNALMLLVGFSGVGVDQEDRAIDEFLAAKPFRRRGCSFRKPQLCGVVQAFYAILHTTRNTRRAGGNGTFGRANFDWHQGGSGFLRYEKRNVLGLSMDFAEDVTKSNWGFEFTWIEGVPTADSSDLTDGLRDVDQLNLTVSVDRPTFVNFLNSNRTLFINSQWFFQYVAGYKDSMPSNGPFNVLATFSVNTGYHQDRLLPSLTLVYDFASTSGAGIPQITYRYTSNFSVSVGAALFFGRWQTADPALAGLGDQPIRVGKWAERDFVENGLSQIRERDEVFLRIRYSF